MQVAAWDSDRLADLVHLWNATSAEPLTSAELAMSFGPDTSVLATADGQAAVAYRHGQGEAASRGNIPLLVVGTDRQRQGIGRALLALAESELRGLGVSTVRLAGGVPRYVWPGIDVTNSGAYTLAVSSGYHVLDHAVNMTIDTGLRVEAPANASIFRIGTPGILVRDLVLANWPLWITEVDIAMSGGTLFVAEVDEIPVGFIAHSTMREGWIGPMGIAPDHQRHGIGAGLLSAACADLRARGWHTADISWVGPTGYFEKHGAVVNRTFARFVKTLK